MGDDELTGSSGSDNPYAIGYETRVMALAFGVSVPVDQILSYLQNMLGEGFVIDGDSADYWNDDQMVHFVINIIRSKTKFKEALETPDLHVVYDGHARYGRGPCFGEGGEDSQGDQWEMGTYDPDNAYDEPGLDGIFRMGYPYVPVELDDVHHHMYRFAPVAAENDAPDRAERHPDAQRSLSAITLPEEYRSLVLPDYASATHRYWGFTSDKANILLRAGWSGSLADPLDLGATILQCRCFCHFGCSSRLHCWRIVRKPDYKDWERDDPPTDHFAYFTTATSTDLGTIYWIYYWLKYDQPNAHQSWWNSLEWAKRMTNARLRSERRGFEIY